MVLSCYFSYLHPFSMCLSFWMWGTQSLHRLWWFQDTWAHHLTPLHNPKGHGRTLQARFHHWGTEETVEKPDIYSYVLWVEDAGSLWDTSKERCSTVSEDSVWPGLVKIHLLTSRSFYFGHGLNFLLFINFWCVFISTLYLLSVVWEYCYNYI